MASRSLSRRKMITVTSNLALGTANSRLFVVLGEPKAIPAESFPQRIYPRIYP
ncbi:hypothetical protein HG15A2_01820 [Adhaeretor mobilis]|uniref:Uncharacterized protein n=1 Tax=Adhaeretor mobilis TaxID=1930276 RepID=A0A517MPV9_9BACT|nr:hypothetical protein HG15A2_01820 [Adhaeretor mobilis]